MIKFLVFLVCLFILTACDSTATNKVKHEVPDPTSTGAKIFSKFCDDCHAPPRIKSHKHDEWRNIVERMQTHRLKKAYHLLTNDERETLLSYLEKHAS